MKFVLAISGGVDSVALLDMVAAGKLPLRGYRSRTDDWVIAHFDHGIRGSSADDAELVKNLAAKYQIECVIGHGHLGKNASEELARAKRYEFLRNVVCGGGPYKIITAHHQDDLLETILMNLIRGTGWRGLAPFWSNDIERPLLNMTKAEIVNYAVEHDLTWTEDETNYSAKYFRNRVRDLTARLSVGQRKQFLELNQKQTKLRAEIENILNKAVGSTAESHKISFITELPDDLATEVLRKITHSRLTVPQLQRLLKFVKTAKSGSLCQPGGKIQIGLYKDQITVAEL